MSSWDGIVTGADLFNVLEGRMPNQDFPGRYNPFNNDPQDDESPDCFCKKHRVEYFDDEGCPECEGEYDAS